ncbi:DUF305 domain-containing protein [Micromonospora okii]|uniref:DUF305 domain-containing protein n=1 Tax=Micromonospora okii TaxID=1182970 RepID=UPI001E533E2E|nr:DUF305 domain-containing protein [Micromonospora okii]
MRQFPALVALAALLAVGGCAASGAAPAAEPGPPAGSAAAQPPNPADVPFLKAMVAHHDRTRVLATEAAARLVDPKLRTLVAAIDATEADELATMRRWLRAVPADAGDPHAGHGGKATASAASADEHAGHGAKATASAGAADEHAGHGAKPTAAVDADLERVRSATADRFDAVLVDVLAAHQRQAAALARAHLPTAVGPDVRDLADRIERSRTAQVKMLSELPAASTP